MAATAARSKTSGNTKQSASSKRSSQRDEGLGLQIRYWKRMKPGRVFGLTVSMPSSKKRQRDEEERQGGTVVVVRPVIAGALVTPSEQRFEAAPGNQITFHVTPLARGRLPRARLEVFAPGQPPETIPLGMKVKTQRLALLLLLLALLVPAGMKKLTTGNWQPPDRPRYNKELIGYFAAPLERDLPPVPLFNEKVNWMPQGYEDYTIARGIGAVLDIGYVYMDQRVERYSWLPNAIGAGFLFLAFVAFVFNKPARKTIKRSIDLPAASAEPGEPAELQPI